MDRSREEPGFSILELMIVVAIIAVLASLAIPAYTFFSRRARSSEAIRHLGTIRTLQIAYKSENDTYITLPANPAVIPTGYQPWVDPGGNWAAVGFNLETRVRYQYKGEPGSTGTIVTSFLLTAQSDFDTSMAGFDTWTLDNDAMYTHTDRYK